MVPLRMKIFEGFRTEDPNLDTTNQIKPTIQSLADYVATEIPDLTTPWQYS